MQFYLKNQSNFIKYNYPFIIINIGNLVKKINDIKKITLN